MTLVAEVWNRELGQLPRSEDVHLERLAEDCLGQVLEVSMVDRSRPTSVVDEHVDTTKSIDRLPDELRTVFGD